MECGGYPIGSTSTTAAERTVWYGHNRQGELTGTVDQNDTLHTYTRDAAGRVTRDLVALAPAARSTPSWTAWT